MTSHHPSIRRACRTLAAHLGALSVASSVLVTTAACSSSDDPGTDPANDGTGGTPGESLPSPTLPTPTGTCPAFVEGRATFTVNGTARTVQLWVDPAAAAAKDGPLVMYWYGTGGVPEQASQGLGAEGIEKIKALGGVVAAPVHINTGIFPWIMGDTEQDYALADEITACAKQAVGIDARRIHSNGFSAGALFTAQLSYKRSTYLASVATYSGGATGESADPNNKFPAMLLFGGPNDILVLSFQDYANGYHNDLEAKGQFSFLCNHGGGHRIPTDAPASVVQFFLDHPYETTPEPYAAALPSSFPSYCTL